MQEARSELKRAHVWTVRRRLAARASRVGVGLLVLPVVLTLLDVIAEALIPHFWGSMDGGKTAWAVLVIAWMGTWMFTVPLSFLVGLSASLRTRLSHSDVSVKEGNLVLSGAAERVIEGARIDSAMVVEPPKGPRHVEIDLKDGDVLHIQSDAAPEADRALVEALGFGGKQKRTSVPLGSARGPLWDGLTALGVGVMTTMMSTCTTLTFLPESVASAAIVAGVVFLVTVLPLSRIFSPRRVVAGADGLAVEGALRRTFYPRDRIFAVERLSNGVAVLLRGEGETVIPIKLPVDSPERTNALFKTLSEALEMGADDDEADPVGGLLARGGEPVRAWRERLRKLVAPVGGYRAQKVSLDALVRTVRDPSAPPDHRIGAALAIAQSGDVDAKKRLRIATDGIVSEGVKSALEAAEADAEDEAIAAACELAEKEARTSGPA